MMHLSKYLRLSVFFFLVLSSAQPSPNFLACTVRMQDLSLSTVPKDDCCGEVKRSASRQEPRVEESINARKYLPCCDSVIPFTSIAEHKQIIAHHSVTQASFFHVIQSRFVQPQIVEWCFVPPSPDVGKEILDLNLRI
jgi:hypothetical protein